MLTLISGFGLGTLLLPVFAVFFPLEVAILLTAVVHLLNNFFKFGMLWRAVHRPTLLRFGVPGIAGAYIGARLMRSLGDRAPLFQGVFQPVDPLDITVSALMLLFGLLELSKRLNAIGVGPRWLPIGGAISGFFGGLSGHQGALRSVFLLRTSMPKETFIATGIAIALLVDLTRLPTYLNSDLLAVMRAQWVLLVTSTVAAFAGAWWGKKQIPKVTMRGVQVIVALLMLAIAALLSSGVI